MRFILASNSPRRREILTLAGLDFNLLPVDVDESWSNGEDPQAYVARLAGEKALVAMKRLGSNFGDETLILAADTTVAVDGDVLGKPADAAQAEWMLRRLRGRSHQVHTALALLGVDEGDLRQDLCTTEVQMRDYSDAEMLIYIASGDPLDKAGAYAIQHSGFTPVESLQGCQANVMGLPLCRLRRMLEGRGTPVVFAPEMVCDALEGAPCQVFEQFVRRGLQIGSNEAER